MDVKEYCTLLLFNVAMTSLHRFMRLTKAIHQHHCKKIKEKEQMLFKKIPHWLSGWNGARILPFIYHRRNKETGFRF